MYEFKNLFFDDINDDSLSDAEKTAIQTKKLIEIENINNNSVIVDLGANKGIVVENLVDTGCTIHAYEPHPMYFDTLKSKFHDHSNVFLHNTAVWTNDEIRKFYFKKSPTAKNGGATLMSEKTNINIDLNIEVQCEDICKIVDRLKFVDVLKIDVEGAEYELLNKIYESNTYKKIGSIYFEDHSRKIFSSRFFDLKSKVIKNFNSINKELYWW